MAKKELLAIKVVSRISKHRLRNITKQALRKKANS
jgi:hypothetical protein